jgi:hypothetical protein
MHKSICVNASALVKLLSMAQPFIWRTGRIQEIKLNLIVIRSKLNENFPRMYETPTVFNSMNP